MGPLAQSLGETLLHVLCVRIEFTIVPVVDLGEFVNGRIQNFLEDMKVVELRAKGVQILVLSKRFEGEIFRTVVALRPATAFVLRAVYIPFSNTFRAIVLIQVDCPVTGATKIKTLVEGCSSGLDFVTHPGNPFLVIVYDHIRIRILIIPSLEVEAIAVVAAIDDDFADFGVGNILSRVH